MPDREKVIYDIERCICHVPDACRDCSHYKHGEYLDCMEELLTDALALLKEQEVAYQGAVELLQQKTILFDDAIKRLKEQKEKTGEWIYKHDYLWYCSRCGEIIYSETDDDLEIHHDYCSRCGAKMKQEGR